MNTSSWKCGHDRHRDTKLRSHPRESGDATPTTNRHQSPDDPALILRQPGTAVVNVQTAPTSVTTALQPRTCYTHRATWKQMTYPADPHAQMRKRVHSVLLMHRQARMLVQPPPVLIRDAVPVLYVQRDDPDLIEVTVARGPGVRVVRDGHARCYVSEGTIRLRRRHGTHTTSRLSRSGTISSTRVLGVFPSAVTPVAQFCSI